MLQPHGRALLWTALGLIGAGVVTGESGAVLAGSSMAGLLHLQMRRLRRELRPRHPPLGISAKLEVRGLAHALGSGQRSHRVGQAVPLVLRLEVPPSAAGARLEIDSWLASAGLEFAGDGRAMALLRAPTCEIHLGAMPRSAAVHKVVGLRGRLTDPLGLVTGEIFLPTPCELAALPRSLPMDLKAVAETRRHSPRSGMGQRPDKVPGSGDDLRELREHQAGDPFKHIAWKASAARGRLMARTFEREQTRALYVVLETGATMRAGVPGGGPIDQAVDLVHSLVETCARTHDPFGLTLVDGRVVESRPILEGLAAVESTDRALLDLRRAVAEDLAPMREDLLLATVAQYLSAVNRVDLPELRLDGQQLLWNDRAHQRVVMAALAHLPERERLPLLRGPEPSARSDLSILRRFCRASDIALDYRGPLPPAQRVAGLEAGMRAAMAARKGPFAILVVSDFAGLAAHAQPLMRSFEAARRAGHRVLAVAVREREERDTLDLVQEPEEIETARGLVLADLAARQGLLADLEDQCRRVGAAFVGDVDPIEILTLWRN
jgi:uncharacterized protein (DUF58 family)